jgi:hypothetical protein
MASFSPPTFQALALLRFRAATAGDKAIKSFQSYNYEQYDALEPFRFEALCRITSIAEFSSSMPEIVLPLDTREIFRITADLLDEWIDTSAQITREVYALDPESLSPTGQRMVDFLAHILTPHRSVYHCLPSKSFCTGTVGPPTQQQIILDFFEDCNTLLLPIRSDLREACLQSNMTKHTTMSQIYAPLNTFIFAPAIHFFHWLLYYWRRHATTMPALPFSKTVIEEYKPTYLKTRPDQPRAVVDQSLEMDPKVEVFWRASKYPVRGVWGCLTVYDLLRDLLEENMRIASRRLLSGGVVMSASLGEKRSMPIQQSTLQFQASISSLPPHYLIQKVPPTQTRTKITFTGPMRQHRIPAQETGSLFTCPSCTTPNHFTIRKDLRRHIDSIHTRKLFWCKVKGCSRGEKSQKPFNRLDNLARHEKRVHGNQS